MCSPLIPSAIHFIQKKNYEIPRPTPARKKLNLVINIALVYTVSGVS